MRISKFILIVFCLACICAAGQNTFEKKLYAGYNNMFSTSVFALEDTTFLFLNYVRDSIKQRQDFGLMKIDRYGNEIVRKVFNTRNLEYNGYLTGYTHFVRASNDYYFLSGGSERNNISVLLLTKIDAKSLDTVKTIVYEEQGYQLYLNSFIKLNENKFYLCGNKFTKTVGNPFVLELDSNLSIVQKFDLNIKGFTQGQTIFNPIVKRLIMVGGYYQQGVTNPNIGIIETDTLGIPTNTYICNPTFSMSPGAIYYSSFDSSYVVLSIHRTFNYQLNIRQKINISKYDSKLQLKWRKSYGEESSLNSLFAATILEDGSIVATGRYGEQSSNDCKGVILKVDRNGVPLFMREYTNDIISFQQLESLNSIAKTLDNGLIMVGSIMYQPFSRAWVLKTDSLGCHTSSCPSTIPSVDSLLMDPPKPITSTNAAEALAQVSIEHYPNPVSDFLHVIGINCKLRWSVELIDILGKANKMEFQFVNDSSLRVDCRSVRQGVYLLSINETDGSRWCRKKIVVQ